MVLVNFDKPGFLIAERGGMTRHLPDALDVPPISGPIGADFAPGGNRADGLTPGSTGQHHADGLACDSDSAGERILITCTNCGPPQIRIFGIERSLSSEMVCTVTKAP